MLFFLLLMLLFRSICHQVSNQADKLALLAYILLLADASPSIQVGLLRAMFLTTGIIFLFIAFYDIFYLCLYHPPVDRELSRNFLADPSRKQVVGHPCYMRL